MHSGILDRPASIPTAFGDEVLIRRAAEFRSKTKCSRLPAHIRAFNVRADPKASESDKATARRLIQSLVTYCNKHWRLYIDTIVEKTRSHGFPLKCLSCGVKTRWNARSGLRVGCLDGFDHQYCKKLSANLLPSTKLMLSLPTISNIWGRVRKSHVPNNIAFQQRSEARQLALDLGYVRGAVCTPIDDALTPQHDVLMTDGWYCFNCDKSSIAQPLDRMVCEGCGSRREDLLLSTII